MKTAIFMITLLMAIPSYGVMAQAADDCATCTGPACASKHESCVAECRARYFTVDPKRASCVAQCETTSASCAASKAPPPGGRRAHPKGRKTIRPGQ